MAKKIKIRIESAQITLEGELLETPTAKAFWEILPIKSRIKTWGEEIYYDIPLDLPLEPDAKAEVEKGDIGYWDVGKCMCIFWGRTPASKDEKPIAASPVNIYGKILGDVTVLNAVKDGAEVIVEKIS
ncbi:MAG: cyclophilin-like fold protein [Candidatus Helarchaeota archaeon]